MRRDNEKLFLNFLPLDKQSAEKQGVDYERIRAMDYTVESVERWDEKRLEKKERANTGFTGTV